MTAADPCRAAVDPGMPCLNEALGLGAMQQHLQALFADSAGDHGKLELRAIRIVRHKPGRRCLIEYDIQQRRNGSSQVFTLIGKVRAKGLDRASLERLVVLSHQGFGENSEDGVSVPQAIGCIPRLRMWLQRKVPGTMATSLFSAAGSVELAKRVAFAAHKLHDAKIPVIRRHTMADELGILGGRLLAVAQMKPAWAVRLQRVMQACERLGAAIPPIAPRGIHRDFYPDQVIVDGQRLYLLDLDLYCEGDPALDVGNFLGHLTEQALRTCGDPDGLLAQEAALEERFLQISDAATHLSMHLIYHRYRQDELSNELRDTNLDANPTGESRDIGSAIDFVSGVVYGRWALDIELGYFMPGDAFDSEEDDSALFTEFDLKFKF